MSTDFATSLRPALDVPSDASDLGSGRLVGRRGGAHLAAMGGSRRSRGNFGGNSLLAALRRCLASTLVVVAACSVTGPVDVPEGSTADASPVRLSGYVLKGLVSGATVPRLGTSRRASCGQTRRAHSHELLGIGPPARSDDISHGRDGWSALPFGSGRCNWTHSRSAPGGLEKWAVAATSSTRDVDAGLAPV